VAIITDINALRSTSKRVDLSEVAEIVRALDHALETSMTPGVGLAAPQIGINKRVAIVRTKEQSLNLVNPVIVEKDKGFVNFEEGCLSLPGISVNTRRYKEIFVKDDMYPDGFVATGTVALAIQHECDHLDGILIIDRVVGKKKVGRNDPCPCGKKIKYKKCCGR
jgi:peptide deformylase